MITEGEQLGHGRYRLLNLISRSSTSEIYLAEDTQLSRQVAIKVILPEDSAYPGIKATKWGSRFLLREIEIITKFNHPHILALLGYGEEFVNGNMLAYLVMPFCPEGSLAAWLKRRNSLLTPQDVVQLVQQAAAALMYAHSNQIIHLNVKPSNFLIQRSKGNTSLPDLLLTDFRIIKFNAASLNAGQTPYGTPLYMAPEQWNGHPVPATDQYALAVMAYQLLTGRYPFQGTPEQLKHQHLNVQPQRPSGLNPRLSKDIDEVISHALAKRPEDRFTSVSAFARAFEQAIHGNQKGENIHTSIDINHADAAMGIVCPVTIAPGRTIDVSVPAHATSGQEIVLPGQGKPSLVGGPAGDLIVAIRVTNSPSSPTTLNNTSSSPGSTPITLKRLVSGLKTKVITMKADILLYCVFTGLAGCVAGIALNAAGLLSPLIATIASGIGALIALLAGSWAIVEKALPKDIWQNARKLPVVSLSLITVIIAASLIAFYTYSSTDPYIHQGRLAFDDPLINNSKNLDWGLGTIGGGNCQFVAGGYQATSTQLHVDRICNATATNFVNFVFEVEMTLIQGDCGGVAFRYNPGENELYYFRICFHQSYTLYVTTHTGNKTFRTLAAGFDPANIQRSGQPNLMAVVALNSNITVYANHHRLASVVDTTFSSGLIGVVAEDDGNPTEVLFANARIWTL